MSPAKRTRLYFGLLLVTAGIGASLLGLRAERFVGSRHVDIMESHARRRTDLERLAADPQDDTGRKLLAEHNETIVPRTLERYEFGVRVSKGMLYGGFMLDVIGAALLISHLRRRPKAPE
jgi:hypothetical protein